MSLKLSSSHKSTHTHARTKISIHPYQHCRDPYWTYHSDSIAHEKQAQEAVRQAKIQKVADEQAEKRPLKRRKIKQITRSASRMPITSTTNTSARFRMNCTGPHALNTSRRFRVLRSHLRLIVIGDIGSSSLSHTTLDSSGLASKTTWHTRISYYTRTQDRNNTVDRSIMMSWTIKKLSIRQ
jgi:hypothetical protein